MVFVADEEEDGLYGSERVVEHHALQIGVVATTPLCQGQECPADLDLAAFLVEVVETRRSDHGTGQLVENRESTPGGEMIIEVDPKVVVPPAVRVRVLLPEQRVGGSCIQ